MDLALDVLIKRVRCSHTSFRKKQKELNEETSMLCDVIREYNQKRLEIFDANFGIKDLFWCTKCHQVFSVDQVNFVLTVEKKSKSCGYEGGEYTFETIRILHRVCTDCKAGLFLKNGWYGPYDPVAKGQASYFAYVVQVRDGEYYHGDKKVQEKIPAIPPLLFAQLSEKWGIPKKIALDMHGNLAEEGFVI